MRAMVSLLNGLSIANQHSASLHVGQFSLRWRNHFQHQIGTEGRGIVTDSRANRFIGTVRNARANGQHRSVQSPDGLGRSAS